MDGTPRDDIPREKRANAYWDLRGVVGQWMDQYGQDRSALVTALLRMLAEQLGGLHANVDWRLRRIEQVLELPAHGGEVPDWPGWTWVDGVPSLLEGGEEDAP
jgi:hypothetical protein